MVPENVMQRINGVIKNITVDPANLKHIAETGRINGSLLVDIRGALTAEYSLAMEELEKKDKEIADYIKRISYLEDIQGI